MTEENNNELINFLKILQAGASNSESEESTNTNMPEVNKTSLDMLNKLNNKYAENNQDESKKLFLKLNESFVGYQKNITKR